MVIFMDSVAGDESCCMVHRSRYTVAINMSDENDFDFITFSVDVDINESL